MTETRGPFRVFLLTVSDRGASRQREDRTGPELAARVQHLGMELASAEGMTLPGPTSGPGRAIVEDGLEPVALWLKALCDGGRVDLLLSLGGSGLAPRDQTPEATLRVADREVPGLMELARRRCSQTTPFAALGRGVAVTRGRTLIVNLPGHPRAARETLEALEDVLPHALQTLARTPEDCSVTGGGSGLAASHPARPAAGDDRPDAATGRRS